MRHDVHMGASALNTADPLRDSHLPAKKPEVTVSVITERSL